MRACRGRHVLGLCAALALVLLAGGEARAQIELRDMNELPDQRTLPPYLKYIPTDPHFAIRNYLQATLPPLWWGREIAFTPGRITVEVHPPVGWQGNPTGAMMRFCPGPNHNLWRIYSQIELRPFFEKKNWPAYLCRRT